MTYEKDQFGFPIDPELRRLENHLGDLAATWRWTYDDQLVPEYHKTVALLYELGWDDTLDFESMLPDYLMPQEFMDRQNNKPRP